MQPIATRLDLLGAPCSINVVSSGCAKRTNLVDSGRVKVVVGDAACVRIGAMTVRQGAQDVHISGCIQRKAFPEHSLSRHIDVAVVEPDGRILRQDNVRFAAWSSRQGPRGAFFHVYIPGQLPDGAIIHARYHAGNKEEPAGETWPIPLASQTASR